MRQSATPTDRPAARRRTYGILGLTLMLLTLALALPAGAAARASRPSAFNGAATRVPTHPLNGVDFSDSAHGWAVGEGGALLATADGGATWKAQNSGSGQWLTDVSFADSNFGWAVGDAGVGSTSILATSNGGATWSKQYPKPPKPKIVKLAPASGKRGARPSPSRAPTSARRARSAPSSSAP